MNDRGGSGSECSRGGVLRFRTPLGEGEIPIPVLPPGSSVVDLIPFARAISDAATAIALENEYREARSVSCRAGCGACCRQLVAISAPEAESLSRVVAAMPAERQAIIRERFKAAIQRLEEAGMLEAEEPPGNRVLSAGSATFADEARRNAGRIYFSLRIACPFLEEESCSIHANRPMVCREYHVTTPAENCAQLFSSEVDRVPISVRMAEVLAKIFAKTSADEIYMIPLALSLEWCAAHGAEISKPVEGVSLPDMLVSELRSS